MSLEKEIERYYFYNTNQSQTLSMKIKTDYKNFICQMQN